MRDDFTTHTKDVLAKRVGYRCSNPGCRKHTSGPHDDPSKVVNIGVASHITGASPGGPRFDAALSSDQRTSASNGIWLCQSCGKLVDSDDGHYSEASLNGWKRIAESMARGELEERRELTADATQALLKAERLMPMLLLEMRDDLKAQPLSRELVLLGRGWSYWARGDELRYV